MMRIASLAAASLSVTQDRAKRRARLALKRGAAFGVAAAFFGGGAVYLSIGIYAALAQAFGPVTAALSVGAGLCVLGLVAVLVAMLMAKDAPEPIAALPSQDAAMQALMQDAQKLGPIVPLVALALGFLASRK